MLLCCLPAGPGTAATGDDTATHFATAPGCDQLYADADPRLFEFIATRKAVDFARYQGRIIGQITVLALPVFNEDDPQENNALYRFVNRLHVLTRADPLRRQLLFREGERIDADRVYESERILRGANYLYDAMILPLRVCGDTVDLLVVVRDIWTLQPSASFKRSGGQNSSSFGISDDNILGYGQSLNLSWSKDADRTGTSVSYNNKHLLDGHTELGIGHANNSDGHASAFTLSRPFYALDTRWSAGISLEENLRSEAVASNGLTSNSYDHAHQVGEVYFGVSAGLRDGRALRWRAGITHIDDSFDNQGAAWLAAPPPGDRVLAYPWVELERIENDFWTTSNLSQLFRNEDINTGEGWRMRAGATSSHLSSTTDALVSTLEYNNTAGFGSRHLLQNAFGADIYWNKIASDFDNSICSLASRYDYFIDDNDRWHGRISLDAGTGLTADRALTAGGESHLRGYPNHWQRGDRRATLKVERRHFYNAHPLHLFRLGSTAFFETGRAWDSRGTAVQSDKLLADIGIGLRVNSSKARPNDVIHLDLAFPLSDRAAAGDFQWSVYAGESF